MIRVTTNGTLYNYKSNFNQTANQLNSAMMKLMSGRNFDTYAANPAGATRAFQIHSSINATNAQYDNNQTVLSKFETAWSSIQGILDGFDGLTTTGGQVPILGGINDTNLTALNSQGQILRESAEGIIQSLNAKYGDDYIFAGADSQNPPFGVDEEVDANGITRHYVTYRGIRIDDPVTLAQENLTRDANGKLVYYRKDADGNPILDNNGNRIPLKNQEILEMWNEEHQYVDIGLGFELDGNGEVIPSTAFDSAISGIGLIGFGVDDDDDPLNVVSVMFRMSEIFENYDEENTEWNPNAGTREDAERLLDKFNAARQAMSDQWVELDTQAKFLNNNKTQLEGTFDALNVELTSLEDVDTADAILELSWAQVCYNAALQVGANVIPQSLMDYLQ